MSFFSGIFIGVVVGVLLIIALARVGNVRAKHRSDLATTIAAFARMTAQDSRKILPKEFYPSWVVFTQRQKIRRSQLMLLSGRGEGLISGFRVLTWLNLQLDKIWPYVDAAASELIRSNVEPVLEQFRPMILSSLKFSKLTLGSVAPNLTGIAVLEDESDTNGITLELEMQWDGNPNIVLDIKTKLGVSLPVQVKDVAFTGLFRLMFKPLVDEFPCFGAVCYSLRKKIIGGDISSIPGVSDAIEETIRDAIEGTITWPVRQIVPILAGDYSDLEVKPVGTLEVKLVQAKELTNKDIIGKSDPYAVLFVRPLKERMKTSKTINNQLNPIWNEHFDFIVEDASTQHLTIRVFDDEGVQASELIGCAQVALKDLEPGKVKDVWLKLVKDLEIQRDNKYRGQVHLELLYYPFGTDQSLYINPFNPDYALTSVEKALKMAPNGSEDADSGKQSSPKKRDTIVRGVLSVTVIAAEDLPAVDFMGKADPYVVLTMKKSETKVKTRLTIGWFRQVVHDTVNPVWNQTFDFLVEDALHDMLMIEVWDHDTFGKDKLGRVIMTLTRAILEGEIQDSFPLEGAKSGRIFLHLKWAAQPIFRDT
uniref:Synaptotagmin-5-like n=1 Tax=Cucumis melo TaxID=3656 RepID=A0A9I9CHM1_CUCME